MLDTFKLEMKEIYGGNAIFMTKSDKYFFHGKTLKIFKIDDISLRFLDNYQGDSEAAAMALKGEFAQEIIDKIKDNFQSRGLDKDYSSKEKIRIREFCNGNKVSPERYLLLNLSHSCNLKCRYCYASKEGYLQNYAQPLMDVKVAKEGISRFIIDSVDMVNKIQIIFFGGEPLLNFRVLREAVNFAEKLASEYSMEISFSVTSNGLLLDPDKLNFLKEHQFNIIISIDGEETGHDKYRVFEDGSGSYIRLKEIILPALKIYKSGILAKATITPENCDIGKIGSSLENLGFSDWCYEIGYQDDNNGICWNEDSFDIYSEHLENFINILGSELLASRNKGASFILGKLKKLILRKPEFLPCLMGRGNMVLTPEGEIYPCQRLVGDKSSSIGSLSLGVNKATASDLFPEPVIDNISCRLCWARYLCGGGCPASEIHSLSEKSNGNEWLCRDRQLQWRCTIQLYLMLKENNYDFQKIKGLQNEL